MSLLPSLLNDALHLVVTGLDVLCFFIVVRLLAHHLSFPGLTAFDNVGRPLVRWFVARVERGLDHISQRSRPEQTLLAYGLLIAATLRFCLAALAASLSTV
jgi:hypothetical protein